MEARKPAASPKPADLTASTSEEALAVEAQKRQREAWLEENREAIEAYNEHVAQHGVFSTGLRGF